MTTETAKLKLRLAALASSVNDLEELLDPLFAQSLPESIMALEPMQQAKLQTALPYLVYDLIFSMSSSNSSCYFLHASPVYLKARGMDPRSHPVVSELVRSKTRMDMPSYLTSYYLRIVSSNTLKR
jgi:exosome complex protein LRP1